MMITLPLFTVCWFRDMEGECYLINIVDTLIMVR